MRDPWSETDLAGTFHDFAASATPRAPLYAALAAGIARDRRLFGLLHHAPETQRTPVLLLACVHSMLLAEPDDELAQWYPNLTSDHRSPDDPALLPAFARFAADRAPTLIELLATRHTQTNEVGRCALLLLAFGPLAAECGALAHVDVGTSAGLTLLLDRYAYRYEPDDGGTARAVGGPSTVVLATSTRGVLPVPHAVPPIAARVGLDAEPVDLADDDSARWLEACVWPDQPDRFHRLRAAIEIARAAPPEILRGDAVATVSRAVGSVASSGHPVVTNTWVLNYLTGSGRTEYVHELDRLGTAADLSWVFLESPAMTPELPWPEAVRGEDRSVSGA